MILAKHEIQKRIESAGLVSGFVDLKEQLQPSGIDLTLYKVYEFATPGSIDFDNSQRKLSECKELGFDADGWVFLQPGIYKVKYNEEVKLPADLAAINILRSSLMRCGCILHEGYWDLGFEGRGESALLVGNSKGLKLKRNAKIAQLVFFRLSEETKETYSGIHHKKFGQK